MAIIEVLEPTTRNGFDIHSDVDSAAEPTATCIFSAAALYEFRLRQVASASSNRGCSAGDGLRPGMVVAAAAHTTAGSQ